MPVLECSCGMVMSVSTSKPRASSIRCSGENLHELFTQRVSTPQSVERIDVSSSRTPNLGCFDELLQFDATSLAPLIAGC
jgi:hypothetical protein